MGRLLSFPLLVVFSVVEALVLAQSQDPSPAGFISIDCGATSDYHSEELQLIYKTDEGFVDSGISAHVLVERPPSNSIFNGMLRQSKTLRYFPDGKRNCYTLRPEQGKWNMYLIRGWFHYGNYDNKNNTPIFDLHIGVNYWTTVKLPQLDCKELYYFARTDDIQVCLINIGEGIPYISALELRLLDNTTYSQLPDLPPLHSDWQANWGSPDNYRYPVDVYDRIWWQSLAPYFEHVNTNLTTALRKNNYKVPAQVLRSAVKAVKGPQGIIINSALPKRRSVYLHFAELEKLPRGQRRELFIQFEGEEGKNITLPNYLMPMTVHMIQMSPSWNSELQIIASDSSASYPPMVNAVQQFLILDQPIVPTAQEDVNAINDIKNSYGVLKDVWQGDPCVPQEFVWRGLTCNYTDSPKITALNMSSSGLKGIIAASFANLTSLESLDLSFNELTGQLPDFLAFLPNLRVLNLSGNNLQGPLPEALTKNSTDKIFILSLDGNPQLCLTCSSTPNGSFPNPSKNGQVERKHTIIPVSVGVASTCFILILLCVVVARLRMVRRKRQGVSNGTPGDFLDADATEGTKTSRSRPFTYEEISKITDNFKNVIGEGGFGKVYLGTLANGTNVAVKMLCQASQQGFKEFQAEVQHLMVVHHRNLVSLVGYCDYAENMTLVYEFMINGNLRRHLSDQSTNARVLTWIERLRIALDTSLGLDYLHNGCKPPIIHTDLKSANILLNESMEAKIADFGLSRSFLGEDDTHVSTHPAGTPGYLDPEFQTLGKLNKKTDVYSFGVVLFELITGHPALMGGADDDQYIHILQWVRPIINRGDSQSTVDPRLQGEFGVCSARKLVDIALSCVLPTSIQRPDISHVLAELKECWDMETASNQNQRLMSVEPSFVSVLSGR